jgi:hypothetical protein
VVYKYRYSLQPTPCIYSAAWYIDIYPVSIGHDVYES